MKGLKKVSSKDLAPEKEVTAKTPFDGGSDHHIDPITQGLGVSVLARSMSSSLILSHYGSEQNPGHYLATLLP